MPLPILRRARSASGILAATPHIHPRDVSVLGPVFEFKNDEREFVLDLLQRRSNYWVFRSNQQRFCGDFVVVDMSATTPERRRVFVIDLKFRAPLRLGGGGAGVQFRNAARAVAELAGHGVVGPDASFQLVSGAREEVLAHLGVVTA
ncbi:MAG: hypothetical protein AB2A00_02960 [Myxococcota bacterium]